MGLYTKIKGDINYVEMGSPTILDGVISGFSTSNYLKLPTFAPGNKSWELKLKFLSNNAGTTQTIVRLNTGTGDYGGMLIGMNANNRLWWNIGSSGTSWFQTNPTIDPVLTNNTWYEILVKYDGSKYTLSIINNGVATVAYTNNTATPIYQQGDTTIGARVTGTTNYFRGSVDLNSTYIKIENTVLFGTSFSKVKINTGLTKYIKVGNLIDNNGVISGFTSSSTYVYFNSPFNTNSNFEILLKLNTGNMTDNFRAMIRNSYGSDPGSGGFAIGIAANGSNKYIRSYLTYEDGTLFANGIWGQTAFQNNIDFLFKFSCINNILKIETSLDNGITWIIENSWNMTQNLRYSGQGIALGGGYLSIATQWWSGSIDIGKSYIKVDNGYYWRGSHQNINAWKIQQDNFSKYYTIVDGKLMWASPDIYLRNADDNYIDTEVIQTNNTRTIIKASRPLDSTISWPQLMGGGNGTGQKRIFYNPTNIAISGRYYDNRDLTTLSVNNIFTVDYDKNKLSIVGGSSLTTTAATFTDTQTAWIFNSHGVPQYPYHGDIYYSKFYENDVLIRHFVPVPKGLLIGNFVVPSNGMFDIVEQKFYENKGTGEFTIGGIPPHYIIEGGKLIWCNPNIYLESTGTQWISTGIDIYQATNHKLCFDFIPTEFYNYNSLFGVTTDDNDWEGWIYSNGQLAARYNNTRYASDIGITVNTRNYVEYIKTSSSLKRILNGTETSITSVTTSSRTGITIIYHSGPDYSKLKMFSFKLFTDTLQQCLVPVPKGMLIGDKIAPSNCMFDMVTQQFFTNQGTGDFIIGGIPSDYMIEGDKMVWCNPDIYLSKSSGVPYFNSGIIPTNKTEYEFSYKQVSLGKVSRLYGYWNNGTSGSYNVGGPSLYGGVDSSYNHYAKYNDSTTFSKNESTMSSNTKHTISLKDGKYYFDGVEQGEVSTSTQFTCNGPMFVGNINIVPGGNNVVSNNGDLVYSWLCWNNSRLLQYLVPVPKNMLIKDKIAPSNCMFDLVTQKFFTNQGTGDFAIGGLSGDLVNTDDNIVWTHDNVYLQSSGTEWIDTEFCPNQDTKLELLFSPIQDSQQYSCIFGVRNSSSPYAYYQIFMAPFNYSYTTCRHDYGTSNKQFSYTTVVGQKYDLVMNKNEVYINGILASTKSYETFQNSNTITLYGSNVGGSVENTRSKKKYYKAILWDNILLSRCYYPVDTNTVIGDFTVPAPGMWDAVNKKFYSNAGTGTFTYGKDS